MATQHKGDFFIVATLQKKEENPFNFDNEYDVVDNHFFIDEASALEAITQMMAIEKDDVVYHVARVGSAVQ